MAHRRFISAVGSGLVVLLLSAPAFGADMRAYITHYDLGKVSVVDTTSGDVVARIDVGAEPSGVATTPGRVYVTNSASNTVSVIDTTTNTVVKTIPVGNRPFGIAADPSGQRVWVANQWDGTLSVIDTTTNEVVGPPVKVGAMPVGVAVHPAGIWIFVTSLGAGNLEMVSPSTLQVIYSVLIGPGVQGLAVSPDGTRVWVAFQNGGPRLAIVDVETREVQTRAIGTSPFAGPFGVAVDPQGSRVYVSNPHETFLSVIDATTSEVLPSIPLAAKWSAGVSVHPTANQVWIANELGASVRSVGLGTGLVTEWPVDGESTSFGAFIAAPGAQGCDDGLRAAVEQALGTVEAAMRRSFYKNFTVSGDTAAARVRRLGDGVKVLSRGHLTGVYHNLLRVPRTDTAADPEICDEGLKAAVQAVLSDVEGALKVIDKNYHLPGGGMVRRLQHLADAVAGLAHGRLQGLYWTLR